MALKLFDYGELSLLWKKICGLDKKTKALIFAQQIQWGRPVTEDNAKDLVANHVVQQAPPK